MQSDTNSPILFQETVAQRLSEKWRQFFAEANEEDWHQIAELPYGGPKLSADRYYYSPFDEWKPAHTKGPVLTSLSIEPEPLSVYPDRQTVPMAGCEAMSVQGYGRNRHDSSFISHPMNPVKQTSTIQPWEKPPARSLPEASQPLGSTHQVNAHLTPSTDVKQSSRVYSITPKSTPTEWKEKMTQTEDFVYADSKNSKKEEQFPIPLVPIKTKDTNIVGHFNPAYSNTEYDELSSASSGLSSTSSDAETFGGSIAAPARLTSLPRFPAQSRTTRHIHVRAMPQIEISSV